MREPQGRHELKHYINYADVLQLRSRLPFVTSLDKNAAETNGYRVKSKKNGICFKENTIITADECTRLLDGDLAALKENGMYGR